MSVICVSGTAETPTFSWDDPLLPDVRLIQVYDETFDEWTWGVRVARNVGDPLGRIDPPISYAQRSENLDEFFLPLPLIAGHHYRLELQTSEGILDIVFIPR